VDVVDFGVAVIDETLTRSIMLTNSGAGQTRFTFDRVTGELSVRTSISLSLSLSLSLSPAVLSADVKIHNDSVEFCLFAITSYLLTQLDEVSK